MNIGVFGLGNIAARVIEGIKEANDAKLYCVVSRNTEKAKKYHENYGSIVYYDSYEVALKDNNLDLVYISVINKYHFDLIKLCLEYGKHVICEKPMVLKTEEVDELYRLAGSKHLFLMEAHKTLFIPIHKKIKELISDGVIGEVKSIKADYCVKTSYSVDHWINDKEFGGCLNDIGVYPICFSNSIAQSKIKNIMGVNHSHGTNTGTTMIIEYDNSIVANIECSWNYNNYNKGKAIICGTLGKIEVLNYWKNNKFSLYKDGQIIYYKFEQNSEFKFEIDEAVSCIKKGLYFSINHNPENVKEIIKVLNYFNQII